MPFCNCIAQIRTAHRTSVTHHLTFRRMSATGTQYTWYAWRNRPSSKMADMTSLMPHLSMDSTGPGLQSIRTKTPRERCQAVIHYNQTERDKRRLRICLVSETRASSDLDAHRTSINTQTRTLCVTVSLYARDYTDGCLQTRQTTRDFQWFGTCNCGRSKSSRHVLSTIDIWYLKSRISRDDQR